MGSSSFLSETPTSVIVSGSLGLSGPTGQITNNAGNRLLHSSGTSNIFVGELAGAYGTTGTGGNSALGTQALFSLSTGSSNTGLGSNALTSLTGGIANTATGFESLKANVTGGYNVANGSGTLTASTGSYNTAVGADSLVANTGGIGNTAIGWKAGQTTTSGNANTAGSNNTYLGADSGPGSATQFSNSTAIGYGARVSAANVISLGNSSVLGVGFGTSSAGTGYPGNRVIEIIGPLGYGAGISVTSGNTSSNSFVDIKNYAGTLIGNLWANAGPQVYFGINGAGTNTAINTAGGSVGIGTTSPAAKLDVLGTVKLGTAGGVISGMGTCAIINTAWTTAAILGNTCTGVPSATSLVFCAPAIAVAGQTFSAIATAVNTVTIVASVAGTTPLNCYWIQP